MPLSFRRFAANTSALALALTLLAGCSNTVNVASRRGAYDAYLDIPSRAQASYAQKSAFYHDLIDATSSPNAEPYPALVADLQAMQRHVQDMAERKQSLQAFEKRFDQFADTHASVSPDQAPEWAQFQGLDAEFQPLGQGMQVSLQEFNASLGDFDNNLKAYHIEKIKVADVRAELNAFGDEMNQALGGMEGKVKEDHKAIEFAYRSGGDPDLLRQKSEVLDKMDKSLVDTESFQRGAKDGVTALAQSLPEEATFWTGPGMDDDGSALGAMRADHDGFRHRADDFFALSKRFDTVVPVKPQGDDHDHPHGPDQK